MHLQEIGYQIREARKARKLTQAALARAAGVSRVTLNQLESGLFRDLGVRKLRKVLEHVGLTLSLEPLDRRPDFVRMAATSASVSFRDRLTEDELIRALLTGRVAPGKRPHFRALFDEITPAIMQGLIAETSRWAKPGKVEKNVLAIAAAVGASKRVESWLPT
jgi:transcriptional regulator with XRE-family HTH domain